VFGTRFNGVGAQVRVSSICAKGHDGRRLGGRLGAFQNLFMKNTKTRENIEENGLDDWI